MIQSIIDFMFRGFDYIGRLLHGLRGVFNTGFTAIFAQVGIFLGLWKVSIMANGFMLGKMWDAMSDFQNKTIVGSDLSDTGGFYYYFDLSNTFLPVQECLIYFVLFVSMLGSAYVVKWVRMFMGRFSRMGL